MTFRGVSSPSGLGGPRGSGSCYWRVAAVAGLLLIVMALAPSVSAQDTTGDTTGDTTDDAEPLQAQTPAETKEKQPWPLYFEVAVGSADADPISNTLQTLSTHIARSSLTMEDQFYGRTAIGWKMPRGKGDFRLVWTGYKEDGYTMTSSGDQAAFDPDLPQPDQPANVQDPIPWWQIEIVDGQLNGFSLLPQWSPEQDTLDGTFTDLFGNSRPILANNGALDCPSYQLGLPAVPGSLIDGGPNCEATFLVSGTTSRMMAKDMQNRVQTVDLIYGREFGKERYTAHWWVGARYFTYKGNIPTAAWLARAPVGSGYTDGSNLALINFSQDTSGFGPDVAMSIFFNFFEKRLSLFLTGQAALMLYKTKVTSQNFFTQVPAGLGPTDPIANLEAELNEDRDKTSWQNSIEGGVRYSFRNGLQLELAYNFTGFLDIIMLPSQMAIPISQATTQGVSAIYDTQDYRLSAWRGGVAFQF